MYRLYFWVEGAPYKRPGGPWWYRDFDSKVKRTDFFKALRNSLFSWAFDEGDNLPIHRWQTIYPPEGVDRYYLQGPNEVAPRYKPAVTTPPAYPDPQDVAKHEARMKAKYEYIP